MKRRFAVVTGGAKGIGAEIVRGLCKAGCDVIVNYNRSKEKAETLCREINALGDGRAIPFCADVSGESEARRLIAKAIMEFGRLDILVNNAGVASPQALLDVTEDELRRVMGTNFDGTLFCTRAAAREMIGAGDSQHFVYVGHMWRGGRSCIFGFEGGCHKPDKVAFKGACDGGYRRQLRCSGRYKYGNELLL